MIVDANMGLLGSYSAVSMVVVYFVIAVAQLYNVSCG
jgi:hypothetical protein